MGHSYYLYHFCILYTSGGLSDINICALRQHFKMGGQHMLFVPLPGSASSGIVAMKAW